MTLYVSNGSDINDRVKSCLIKQDSSQHTNCIILVFNTWNKSERPIINLKLRQTGDKFVSLLRYLTSCEILDNFINHSEPQFPYLLAAINAQFLNPLVNL